MGKDVGGETGVSVYSSGGGHWTLALRVNTEKETTEKNRGTKECVDWRISHITEPTRGI